eukprot:10758299-Ditylum_brightwellii.AAC.1
MHHKTSIAQIDTDIGLQQKELKKEKNFSSASIASATPVDDRTVKNEKCDGNSAFMDDSLFVLLNDEKDKDEYKEKTG